MTSEIRIGQVRIGYSSGSHWKVLEILEVRNGKPWLVSAKCVKVVDRNMSHMLGRIESFHAQGAWSVSTWLIVEQGTNKRPCPEKGYAKFVYQLENAAA